jgi:hypothetical protein
MNWSIVQFGQYKGKTLPEIVFRDPGWFFWAYEKNLFWGSQVPEAEAINRRARRIRVPPNDEGQVLVVEYATRRTNGKFCGMELVPSDRPRHSGTPTERKPLIDLSFAKSCGGYDQGGNRLIVRQATFILFGDESARMTAQRAAAFFDEDANFDLS